MLEKAHTLDFRAIMASIQSLALMVVSLHLASIRQ